MKKIKTVLFFSLLYSVFISLLLVSFLNLLGIALAVGIDGRAVAERYPRFIPFCVIVGALSFFAILAVFHFNKEKAVSCDHTARTWCVQVLLSIAFSLPLTLAMGEAVELLQRAL
jgi:hypothetical protein